MRQRVHPLCVDPELLRVLRRARGQQRGRRVSPTSERDHRRLRRNSGGRQVQVHRKNQVDGSYLHGSRRFVEMTCIFSFFSLLLYYITEAVNSFLSRPVSIRLVKVKMN